MNKQRIGVFVDGANHSEALNQANVKMNYRDFLRGLDGNHQIVAARYYSGVSDKDAYKNVRDFLSVVSKAGFALVTKPIREFPDGTVKGNVDIEIAVDIMAMVDRLDQVMLFSGDGDFIYLVNTIQQRGVYVTVCSHKPFASVELRESCNEFLEIRDLTKRS